MTRLSSRSLAWSARARLRGLKPKSVAIASLILLAGAGWAYLGLALAGHTHAHGLNPMGLLLHSAYDDLGRALFDALCRPTLGKLPTTAGGGIGALAAIFAMWIAMSLAMMLPTAGPMILTYAEIAEAAADKGTPVASPLLLVAGYLAVWLGFALAATVLQLALVQAALLDPAIGNVSPLLAGAIFLGAGVYQFSPLKHACVSRCQRPFPFFLLHWSPAKRGVFRLGLWQGVFCLGCCWALMLVMFAVGVMNILWMVGLGLIMAGEKIATTTRLSLVIGIVFTLLGVAVIGLSIAAHWPVA